jgi:hypothetical protein
VRRKVRSALTFVVSVNTTVAPAWAGLQVRRCPALRRTHLIVYGRVDDDRLVAVRTAVASAFAEGHKVTFDLRNLTLVERTSIEELLDLAEESTPP